MRKTISIFACIMLAVLVFTSCNSGTQQADLDPKAVAEAIRNNVTFQDENMTLAADTTVENYYRLDDTITEYAIYTSGGYTAEEVAVLKVGDKKDLDGAKAFLERRVQEQKQRFENYVPGEMVKLEAPVIVTKGNLAILVLADDSAQAEQAIKDATEPAK